MGDLAAAETVPAAAETCQDDPEQPEQTTQNSGAYRSRESKHFGREVSMMVGVKTLKTEFASGQVTFADRKAFGLGVTRQSRRGLELPGIRQQGHSRRDHVSSAASSRLLRGMRLVSPPPEYQLYARPVGISDLDKVVPLGDLNYAVRGGVPGNFQSSAPALHQVVGTEESAALWPHTAKMNVRWEGNHIDHGKDDPAHEYVREWTKLTQEERGQHWRAGPYSTLPKKQDLLLAVTESRRDLEGVWQPPAIFDSEQNLARFGRLGQYARDVHAKFDVRKQRTLSGSSSAPVLPCRVENQIRQDRPSAEAPSGRRGASAAAPRGHHRGEQPPRETPGEGKAKKPAHHKCVQGAANRAFHDGGPLLHGQENSFARNADFNEDYDLYTRPLDSSFLDRLLPMGVRQRPGEAGPAWDGLTQNMPRAHVPFQASPKPMVW